MIGEFSRNTPVVINSAKILDSQVWVSKVQHEDKKINHTGKNEK